MTRERVIELPAWCTLTDEEIVTALAILSQRKKEGVGFQIGPDLPDWYVVKVPVNCALQQEDIVTTLNVANRAAQERYADAVLKFQDGRIVNKKIELKADALGNRLRLGGPRIPEF